MSAPRLSNLDHRRVGVLYLAVALVVFVFGGVLALFLQSELLSTGDTLLAPADFGRFVTAHGLLMVCLFLVPAIPAGLGNLVLPRLLGAEDTAQPALGAAAWLLYLLGAVVTTVAALAGGLDGGWDFFAAFRTAAAPGFAQALLTLGVSLTVAGMAGNGVNLMLTIQRRRPAGTGIYDLPPFAWTLYVTAVLHAAAAVVLVAAVTVVSADAKLGWGLIDPAAGGDPLLPQRWFWLFAQPLVYAAPLPAVGVIAEALGRYAGRPVFAPRALAAAVALYGLSVCLSWGQHLFGDAAGVFATVYGGLTLLAIVPSALIAASWLGTLHGGAIRFTAALWYALAAIVTLAIAGAAGLMLATPGTAALLRGTLFASAQFHYLAGGVLLAFLCGLHMWWPELSGRRGREAAGRLGAWLVFVGINAAFAPRLLMGLRGARLGWSGPPGDLGVLSVIGAWLLVLGLAVLVGGLLASWRGGESAGPAAAD